MGMLQVHTVRQAYIYSVRLKITDSAAQKHNDQFYWQQELIIEMRNPNVTWRIILPVYLFTTELRHTCSSLIFF